VRVVVAEPESPGSLHYLLEAEGFQVVGSATDEHALERILDQDIGVDAIVLDGDIVATSALAARRHAPDAHVVVIWPDGVQPPRGAERVSPAAVYEELGPTIRRHADTRAVAEPFLVLPDEEVPAPVVALEGASTGFGRTASRVSLTTVTLIGAIVFTMGVSFALGGYRGDSTPQPQRAIVPHASVSVHHARSNVDTGRETMHPIVDRGRAHGGCAGAPHGRGSQHGHDSSCTHGKQDRRPHAHRPAAAHPDPPAPPAAGGNDSGLPPSADHPGDPDGGPVDHPGHDGGNQGHPDEHDGEGEDDQGQNEEGDDEQGEDEQGEDGDRGSGHRDSQHRGSRRPGSHAGHRGHGDDRR
jgi:hypothetical protein